MLDVSIPAFARPASKGNNYATGETNVIVDPQKGMSLRDYFAAKAMQGLLASLDIDNTTTAKNIARFAYEQADAMLFARDK